MTDLTPPIDNRSAFAGFGIRKPRAFDAADRHSARVRFLRHSIVVVCAGSISLIGVIFFFDPLHRLKLGLAIGSVGLSGTKVTMHDPKLSGVRKDGHAYEVKAAAATQDTKVPGIIDLDDVDLRLGQSDGSTTRITSRTGRYMTDNDRLDLAGSVRFLNQGHYDMDLQTAVMDMRGGEIMTENPATVVIPNGKIAADALRFSEQAATIVFTGRVHSEFLQPQTPDEAQR